jgi:hypothetical protein
VKIETKAAMLAGASVYTACILPGLLLAPPAHAQPFIPDSAVCETLSSYPSLAGLKGVLQGVMDQGYTAFESGRIVASAVYDSCPTFVPLLDQFVAIYAPKGQIA